jgi:protein gp37
MFDRLHQGLWWDVGLQLVEGCTKVSPGCDNCWSLTAANMRRFSPNFKMQARYSGTVFPMDVRSGESAEKPAWTGQVNLQWDDLGKIGRSRKPQVYTFWNDLFHPGVEEEFIDCVLHRIRKNHRHFYIICTKRPERARDMFIRGCVLPDAVHAWNLMIMTSVENQAMADLRLPVLLQVPGVMHGVSVEPGLGLIDLERSISLSKLPDVDTQARVIQRSGGIIKSNVAYLDWVICGGETGPQARPLHPDIPRKLRDDCQAAGVPFFFKAWGEWLPFDSWEQCCQEAGWGKRNNLCVAWPSGVSGSAVLGNPETAWNDGCRGFKRVGKKAAGRLLDGREWNEVPRA